MVAPIQLEQHPFLGHPLPSAPVPQRPALAWAGQPAPDQEPPHGGAGQHYSLPIGQQLGQVSMVDAAISLLGQGHHLLPNIPWSGIGRHPAPVLMHQSSGPFPLIGR